MSVSAPSTQALARQHPSSHPTTLALAPYGLAALIVAGVIVLLALGKITETAGVGLLGVIVGHGGSLVAVRAGGSRGGS